MRHQGKITDWKDNRGFGFITPKDGGEKVFVHIKSFVNRQRRPAGNEIVTYDLKTDANGRIQAESVAFFGECVPQATKLGRSNVPLILAIAFLVFVSGSVFAGKLPFAVLVFYFVASTVAFVAYALDQSAARNDQWRTRESTLHLLELIGGWPGALAAQNLLRHKTKKQSFQIMFWVTVVLNCGALGWLFSSKGAEALHSILGIFELFQPLH
jgi:uncharacterized membrane protein YsdA (DUF1294 family)/cold shock CspA family protein